MSLSTGEVVEFEFPRKPSHKDPFAIAQIILKWADVNAPFVPCESYRPDLPRAKTVNCYGVTQAVTQLAEAWDLPAAVCLDKYHARPIVKIGQAVLSIDPVRPMRGIRGLSLEAYDRDELDNEQLAELYENCLPNVLETGDFSMYFIPPYTNDLDKYWRVKHTSTINTGSDLSHTRGSHIIVDSRQGAEMLCAIGELNEYKQTDKYLFEEMLPELVSYVPDFIDIEKLDD